MQAVLWRTEEKTEKNQKNDSENLQNMMVKNESSRDSDLGSILQPYTSLEYERFVRLYM
jgi:hypothetical protein